MSRFNVVKASKFEKLSMAEMQATKGGRVCISCMKRERKVQIGVEGTDWYVQINKIHADTPYDNIY